MFLKDSVYTYTEIEQILNKAEVEVMKDMTKEIEENIDNDPSFKMILTLHMVAVLGMYKVLLLKGKGENND